MQPENKFFDYFINARNDPESYEEIEEETPQIFESIRQERAGMRPPIGIASKELTEKYLQNDEDELRKYIQEMEDYKKETGFQTAKREVLSHGARALEGFLGGIGSFANFIIPDLNEPEERISEIDIKLPTAEKYRDLTKKLTGSYLEPKSEMGKTSQEVVEDIGTMFSTPGLGFWQKILLPIGGQSVKQAIKSVGGSEKAQDYGKLGFMLMSSIASVGNARKAAATAYNEAVEMVPKGLKFNASSIHRGIQNLKNQEWYKTGATPSKNPAIKEMDRIEKAIKNNVIDARETMQLRKDINEARKQLKGFNLERPADTRSALKYLDEVDDALLEGMKQYGTHVNPKWWNAYNLANQAYRITERSKLVSDFIEKVSRPVQSKAAQALFHICGHAAAASGLVKAPMVAAGALPVIGAAQTVKIMNRMIKSPVLRNHYNEVLKQASLGNAAMMNKALEKFDKEALKQEKNQ